MWDLLELTQINPYMAGLSSSILVFTVYSTYLGYITLIKDTVHLPCKESGCWSSNLGILAGAGFSIIPSDLIVYLKNNKNISVA